MTPRALEGKGSEEGADEEPSVTRGVSPSTEPPGGAGSGPPTCRPRSLSRAWRGVPGWEPPPGAPRPGLEGPAHLVRLGHPVKRSSGAGRGKRRARTTGHQRPSVVTESHSSEHGTLCVSGHVEPPRDGAEQRTGDKQGDPSPRPSDAVLASQRLGDEAWDSERLPGARVTTR